jgi:hypothetical protein
VYADGRLLMAWPSGVWDQIENCEDADCTDEFDAIVDTESKISTNSSSPLVGSYDMEIDLKSTTTAAYGQMTGPTDEKQFTLVFRVDTTGLTMANNDVFFIARMAMTSGTNPLTVRLRYRTADGFQLLLNYGHDGGSANSSAINISGHVRVIASCKISSAPGANDGWVVIYVCPTADCDGETQGTSMELVTGIDSDTLDGDTAEFGAVAGIDAGNDGTFRLDNMGWRDDFIYPISAASALTPTGGLTKLVLKNIESLILLMYSTVTKLVDFSVASSLTPTGGVTSWSRLLTGVIRFIESAVGTIMKVESSTANVTYDESPTGEIEND